MDPIDKMKRDAERPLMMPSCKSCRHLTTRREPMFWKCGAQGGEYTDRVWRLCAGNLWEPEPPKPPSFWSRLGDAIIERVKR